MAVADLVDTDTIGVVTSYRDRELIRQVPGAKWNAVDRRWEVPLSWGSCQILRGIFTDQLQVADGLAQWSWHDWQTRVAPALSLRQVLDMEDPRLNPRLLSHQRVDVNFLLASLRALLANEMGLGKTISIIETLRLLGPFALPACCIVPNSVKRTWVRELTVWYPWATPYVITGSATKRHNLLEAAREDPSAFVIINYEAVRLHSRLAPYGSIRLIKCRRHGGDDERVADSRCEVHPKELNEIPFKTVIVDEAHKMKDPKAKQTRGIWAVQHGPSVDYSYALTGTPIANDPGDLWAIMHGIAPRDYPVKTKWIDRYGLQAFNAFGGLDVVGIRPDTRDEFFRVLDPRMRRMTKDVCLKLPPKVRIRRDAELPPKLLKAYHEIESGLVTRLEDGGIVLASNNLVKNVRLLQFSSAYATVETTYKADADGFDHEEYHVRLQEPSPKLDVLDELLDELGDQSVCITAVSRQLLELAILRLEKRRISYRTILGGMTEDQREVAETEFQAGVARVMIFTMQAGGIGLTFTKAGTIIFLQRSWSMLENKQAEDRVHRIGSEVHTCVNIIDVVAPGTVEEEQIERVTAKLERLEEIARDRELLRAQGNAAGVQHLDQEEEFILSSPILPFMNTEEAA